MLKSFLVLSTIFNITICVLYAQPSASVNNKSLLWRVSSKEMKKPSYLFGTIHLICPADYVWTHLMQKSLKESEEVCFEMDMDNPSLLTEVAAGMIDNSGKVLSDYFTKEEYDKVKRFLEDSLSMNISMFRQMKPAAVLTIFSSQVVSCDNPVSYEGNIMDEAKKYNKYIGGIEAASEQIELFDSMPIDSVIDNIIKMTEDYTSEKAEYQYMVTTYKNQDLPTLYEVILKSEQAGDNLGVFLDERNEKWIEKMIEKMDQHAVFFAVGAGHLLGDKGLIKLLRNNGYTVEPVINK